MTDKRAEQIINRPILQLYAMAEYIEFWDECAGELPDAVIFPYIIWSRNGKILKGVAYNIAHARMLAGRDDYKIINRLSGEYTKSPKIF